MTGEVDAPATSVPPWCAFPEVHPTSIGWRMGAPEEHLMRWVRYVEPLSPEGRLAALVSWPAAPRPWRAHVERLLAWGQPGGPLVEEGRADTEGYVANDIAFTIWLGLSDRDHHRPWADGLTPAETARFNSRELTYRVWALRARPNVGQSATLPEGWRSLVDFAGDDSHQPLARSAWDLLVEGLVANGYPAPFWIANPRADALVVDSDDDRYPSYEEVWWSWFYDTIDDAVMWNRYATHFDRAPASPAVLEGIERHLGGR